MNPIPHNLRHLQALFDHYNVDTKGHFFGESSSFYLCCKPALPLLSANANTSTFTSKTPDTHVSASALNHLTVTDTLNYVEQNGTSFHRHTNSSSRSRSLHSSENSNNTKSSALPYPSQSLPSGTPATAGTSANPSPTPVSASTTYATSGYRDPDFPVVAQSAAVLSHFPPPRLARELIVLYLSKVNRFIPIIPTSILDEYDAGVAQSPLLLLAIFAIASKYSPDPMCRSVPMRAQTAGEDYCKTACRLIDEFMDYPRLSTIQALLILGKHLEESKNQRVFSKSFMYIGMAVRMAMDMGLNRDCSGWGLDPIQEEYRNRIWWFLYVYDRLQGATYGRPYLIQDQDCGAEKPKPDPMARSKEHDQAEIEYFLNLIHLSALLGRVMKTFYPANNSSNGFYCDAQGTYGSDTVGGRDVEHSRDQNSAGAGAQSSTSRKRSKPSSRTKLKPQDQDKAMHSNSGIVGGSTSSSSGSLSVPTGQDQGKDQGQRLGLELDHQTTSSSLSHQDMLTRQCIANQKLDAAVVALDKALTEWAQALPPHLQWNNLQSQPSRYGDILHGIYYMTLILLHRPCVRVGELMLTTPYSKQDKCPSVPETIMALEGCHSMAVCAQAARRITKLSLNYQNLTHLEHFGAGAYIFLQAARVHLMLAAMPPTMADYLHSMKAMDLSEGMDKSNLNGHHEVIEAIRKKEEAIDNFHRTLGSLRKFSVYHWTLDGVSLSIQSLERTLAAILQEQELDHEQAEAERQRQTLIEYDAEFFDWESAVAIASALPSVRIDTATAASHSGTHSDVNTAQKRNDDEPMNFPGTAIEDGTASRKKSKEESLHERTYYESMRFMEVRLLYQERHRYSDEDHLEKHLQIQDSKQLSNSGMDMMPPQQRGISSVAVLVKPHHRTPQPNNTSKLFDNARPDVASSAQAAGPSRATGPLSTVPNVPDLIIRAYKPKAPGKPRRRGGSNVGNTLVSSSTIASQAKSIPTSDGNGLRPTTAMAPEDTTITTEHCTESMEDNIKSTCISSGSLSNNDDSNNNDTDNGKINNAPQAPKCSRYETNSSQGDIQPPQLKPPQGNIQNEIILRSQEPTSPVAGAITMATMHSPPDTSIAEPSVDLRIHQQRQLYHSNLYGNTESGPYQSVVAENTALCSKSSGEISISPILSDTGLEERGMINRRNWYEDGYPRQLGEPVFMSEHLFQEQHQQVQQQHFQPSFDQIQRYPQLLQAAFTQPREMQPNHATLQLQNDPYTAPSSTPQSSNMETMSVYTKSPDSNLGSSAITTHLQQSDQQLSILQQQEPLQQITLLDNSHLTLLQQRHELQQTLLMQRQRQAQMSQQVYLSTQETRQNQGPIVELVKQNMGQQHLLQTQYPFWQQQQQKQLEIHHSVFNLNGLVDSPEGSNASMSLSPVPSSSSLSNAATPPPISSNTHSSSVISGYTSADFGGVNDGRGALQQQHSAQLLNRNNFMY